MLRTLGASRRQVLSVGARSRRSLIGADRLAGSGSSAGSASPTGLNAPVQGGRDRPAELAASCSSRARSWSRWPSACCVTLVAALVAGAARHARDARSRRCARPTLPERAPARPGRRRRRRAPAASAAWRCCCIGLFGGIESSGAAAGADGRRRGRVLFVGVALSPRLVQPLAGAGRLADRARCAASPGGWRARTRAQSGPHRHDRGGADDRRSRSSRSWRSSPPASTARSTTRSTSSFAGDLIVQNSDGFSPIPARRRARRIARVDGVGQVALARASR